MNNLEVARIAKEISERLGLNTELTEAIALAHDFGNVAYGKSMDAFLQDKTEATFKHEEISELMLMVAASRELPKKFRERAEVEIDKDPDIVHEITISVQNMVVTVSCDSANFVLLNDSNTIYIEKLEAGKTMDIEIRYRTDLETPPQRYNINLSMSYDNSDAMSLSSAGTIMVEVAQIPDVELAPFNLASELNAGETIQISFQVMNLGRSPIYNARVELSAPGLYPVGTGFIGNMEPGTAATTKLDVFVGMKEDEEERYGGTSGTVNLVYEDEDGQEYVQEVDINTNIQALVISSLTTDSEEEETATAGQWWISVSIGAVVIVTLVAIVRKQRPRRRKH